MSARSTFRSLYPPIAMLLLGAGTFVAIAADVTHHGKLQQADGEIARYLHQHGAYWPVLLAAGFSGLGEFWFLFPLALLVAGFLIWKRQWRALATWATGLIGSTILCGTLKNYFAIPRPARYTLYVFTEDRGFTFPSGHTMGAMITCGLLALLWMRLRPRSLGQRRAAAGAVLLLGMLVAASLLYIGVHYLTDVLGALAVAVAWLGVLRLMLPPALGAAEAPPRAYDQPSKADTQTPVTGDRANAPGESDPAQSAERQIDRGANP